ncbi:MAG: hypothetical protein JWN17_392 [Frankiales bacterium]|nr:hypothetical protein [Frankiales bacterium]
MRAVGHREQPHRSAWVEGERVFGPPSGSFDADWVASAAQSVDGSLDHALAADLARQAWSALRAGVPAASLAEHLRGQHDGAAADVVAAVAVEFCTLYAVDPRA